MSFQRIRHTPDRSDYTIAVWQCQYKYSLHAKLCAKRDRLSVELQAATQFTDESLARVRQFRADTAVIRRALPFERWRTINPVD